MSKTIGEYTIPELIDYFSKEDDKFRLKLLYILCQYSSGYEDKALEKMLMGIIQKKQIMTLLAKNSVN